MRAATVFFSEIPERQDTDRRWTPGQDQTVKDRCGKQAGDLYLFQLATTQLLAKVRDALKR